MMTIYRMITWVLLLISFNLYAQDKIYVSVHQDGKLAVMKDNYGNTPFTLDATFKVIYESPQKYIGDIPITITTSIKYEQANIIGTYRRYAGEVGINFNEINIFPFEIEINPTFNYGYITHGWPNRRRARNEHRCFGVWRAARWAVGLGTIHHCCARRHCPHDLVSAPASNSCCSPRRDEQRHPQWSHC